MGQIKVTDDLLKDVLPKVSDELVKEWESETVENHVFSTGFNRQMKKFIRKHKNKQLKKELMVVGKIAAALLLLIGVCFFGNTMVARANLDILFKKIEVALEDSSMFVYDKETDSYIFNMYEPGYVPEGYEEVLRVVGDRVITISYENKDGEKMYWRQMVVKTGMVTGTDSEYDDIIEKEYAGDNVIIHIYESGLKDIHYEIGNCTLLVCVDKISIEEMYEMIKNMKKIEK